MSSTPFTFGKVVFKQDFTNREAETQLIIDQFKAKNNVVLISPRRWGKTSLIRHTTQKIIKTDKQSRVIYLDLFNIKSEEEFYVKLATEVLKGTISKFDKILKRSQELFKKVLPKISFSPLPESEFSLSFNWNDLKKNPEEVLNLAERIAEIENLHIIICIDEFQNLAFFKEPLQFQKTLRSHWQHHSRVSYCLYGSKEHMMQDIFNDRSYPLYRFATVINLNKIKSEKWQPFIKKRFKDSGKVIDKNTIEKIIQYADNQPFYVQQLSQVSWLLTSKICSEETIDEALNNILNQYQSFFVREMEGLTPLQANFLKAVVEGVTSYGSIKTLKQYKLKSTSNVNRVKKSLDEKQIIRFVENKAEFTDAIFKIWLEKRYF